MGKKLVTLNTCNIYEKDKKFGWISEKPYPTQVSFLLKLDHNSTELTWIVESEETGIVQLAKPLLVRQTKESMRKSLVHLKDFLQNRRIT